MPEPQDDNSQAGERPSKILQFFSATEKELKKEKIKPLTKIVIRRLPPRMTRESFLEAISLPPHDYFYFVRGDLYLTNLAFSRAYVNITSTEDIFAFKEKYDDYLLNDEQGREYHAVVEWAPVQRIPKKSGVKKSSLSKSGTLEADPKYLEFLDKLELEKSTAGAGNTSEYFMETESFTKEAKVTTTPLLEYIKLKRQQKIDIRNENRIRKREAEKEKRKKEDEMKRMERLRREKEKTSVKVEIKEDKVPDINKDAGVSITKDTGEKKKLETKATRTQSSEKNEAKKDDKFEKRIKVPRKIDSAEKINKKVEEKESSKSQITRNSGTSQKEVHTAVTPHEDKTKMIRATVHTSDKRDITRNSEIKSKFRYSELRNRDRAARNQKATHLEPEIGIPVEETKGESEKGQISRQSTQDTSDGSLDGDDGKDGTHRKDPRTERKIRNKDRPAMEIYRPGMGKFSKQRLEQKKDDTEVQEEKKREVNVKSAEGNQLTTQKTERKKDEDIKPFRNRKILDNSDLSAERRNDAKISPTHALPRNKFAVSVIKTDRNLDEKAITPYLKQECEPTIKTESRDVEQEEGSQRKDVEHKDYSKPAETKDAELEDSSAQGKDVEQEESIKPVESQDVEQEDISKPDESKDLEQEENCNPAQSQDEVLIESSTPVPMKGKQIKESSETVTPNSTGAIYEIYSEQVDAKVEGLERQYSIEQLSPLVVEKSKDSNETVESQEKREANLPQQPVEPE